MIENERKFIVDPWDVPEGLSSYPRFLLSQHYLVKGDREIRVREKKDTKTLEISYSLGVKDGGSTQTRVETTVYIDQASFEKLKALSIGSIYKERYYLSESLMLDIFYDMDLILLEIENSDEDPPDWAGEEVTENKKYYNINLSK